MSTKISLSKAIKIFHSSSWGILVIFIILISILSFFLYNNIYKAITQSEEIVVLQGQLALEPVDISLFRTILGRIENKKIGQTINFDNLKNPFLPYAVEED